MSTLIQSSDVKAATNEKLLEVLTIPSKSKGQRCADNFFKNVYRNFFTCMTLKSYCSDREVAEELCQRASRLPDKDPGLSKFLDVLNKNPIAKDTKIQPLVEALQIKYTGMVIQEGDFEKACTKEQAEYFQPLYALAKQDASSWVDLMSWTVRQGSHTLLGALLEDIQFTDQEDALREECYWKGIEIAVKKKDIDTIQKLLWHVKTAGPFALVDAFFTTALNQFNQTNNTILDLLVCNYRDKHGTGFHDHFMKMFFLFKSQGKISVEMYEIIMNSGDEFGHLCTTLIEEFLESLRKGNYTYIQHIPTAEVLPQVIAMDDQLIQRLASFIVYLHQRGQDNSIQKLLQFMESQYLGGPVTEEFCQEQWGITFRPDAEKHYLTVLKLFFDREVGPPAFYESKIIASHCGVDVNAWRLHPKCPTGLASIYEVFTPDQCPDESVASKVEGLLTAGVDLWERDSDGKTIWDLVNQIEDATTKNEWLTCLKEGVFQFADEYGWNAVAPPGLEQQFLKVDDYCYGECSKGLQKIWDDALKNISKNLPHLSFNTSLYMFIETEITSSDLDREFLACFSFTDEEAASLFCIIEQEESALYLLETYPGLLKNVDDSLEIASKNNWIRITDQLIIEHLLDKKFPPYLFREMHVLLWSFEFEATPLDESDENLGQTCQWVKEKLSNFSELDSLFIDKDSQSKITQEMVSRLRTSSIQYLNALKKSLLNEKGKPNRIVEAIFKEANIALPEDFNNLKALQSLKQKCIQEGLESVLYITFLLQPSIELEDLTYFSACKNNKFIRKGITFLYYLGLDLNKPTNDIGSTLLYCFLEACPLIKKSRERVFQALGKNFGYTLIQALDVRNLHRKNCWDLLKEHVIFTKFLNLLKDSEWSCKSIFSLNAKARWELVENSVNVKLNDYNYSLNWLNPIWRERLEHNKKGMYWSYVLLIQQLLLGNYIETFRSIVRGIPATGELIASIVIEMPPVHTDWTYLARILKEILVMELPWNKAQKDAEGDNLLHTCVRQGYGEFIKPLIHAGVSLGSLNKQRDTPLQAAVRSKDLFLVEDILEGAKEASISPSRIGYIDAMTLAKAEESMNIIEALTDFASNIHSPYAKLI